MEDLNSDCVELVLSRLDSQSRGSFALVCKAWHELAQRLESRTRPYPPRRKRLQLGLEDYHATYMRWHLKDTSKLEELEMKPCHARMVDILEGEDYWKWLPRVLDRLRDRAHALRALEVVAPRRIRFRVSPYNFEDLLPRIASISRLERLALRQWRYRTQDVPLIGHLSKLQNLQALEIQDMFFESKGEIYEERERGVKEGAALLLRRTLQALPALTCLNLSSVDLTAWDCREDVLPVTGVGSLSNLRALSYRGEMSYHTVEFPHLQELVRLTSLTLACASSSYGSGRRSITTLLTSLCSLKELVIQKDANEAPLILCPTAELTKISIACSLYQGYGRDTRMLEDILPIQTLRHVRHLAVHCWAKYPKEVRWPTDWGQQLPRLTRLNFRFASGDSYGRSEDNYLFQDFFTEVRGLRKLEVTGRFDMFDHHGGDYLRLLIARLPELIRLQVNLVRVTEKTCFQSDGDYPLLERHPEGQGECRAGRLRQICEEVAQEVPGMKVAQQPFWKAKDGIEFQLVIKMDN